MEPFIVMEVMERAQELEQMGRSIIHLEVGEPDFDTPEPIAKAGLESLGRGETHYTHSLGLPELREAISMRYRRVYNIKVDPDRIVVTPGSSLGLLYVFALLLSPGGQVVAGTPHYPCYPNFIRFLNGELVEIPTEASDGYTLNPARVRSAINSSTCAVLVNSPANPTGAVLDRSTLEAFASMSVPVVSDEIYHGLSYDGRATSVLECTDNAYVLDGFSKRYAMTGWRLGWIVAPKASVRSLQKMQQNFFISPCSFVQRAGIAAVEQGSAFVEAMRTVYDRRRKLMVKLFREIGFGIPVLPKGAFYVYADVSRFTDDSFAFAFELLEKTGVGVAPGVDFGSVGKRAVRLSYAASEDCIKEAARRIGEYLAGRSTPNGPQVSPSFRENAH